MAKSDWLAQLIDDTTSVLDAVVPPHFAPAAKALVATTLTTVPLGAQLVGELAARGPVQRSGTVLHDHVDAANPLRGDKASNS